MTDKEKRRYRQWEQMNRTRIPQIDSIQELANFWDTHDLTDFEDDLEEVDESLFEFQTELVVPLQPEGRC